MNAVRRVGGRVRKPKAKVPGPKLPMDARQGGASTNYGNGSWGLQTFVAAKRAKPAGLGVIEKMFDKWFAEAKPGINSPTREVR